MCIQKLGTAALLLLLLSSCAGVGAAPSEAGKEENISVAALFQTESGTPLCGAACFSTEENTDYYQVDRDGMVSATGLPRDGALLLTLFNQRQEVQGAMTLSFDQGAVIDAMTGEDGVGHVTVRRDTSEVALSFVLTEEGALRCTLWLAGTAPSGAEFPQKGDISCEF